MLSLVDRRQNGHVLIHAALALQNLIQLPVDSSTATAQIFPQIFTQILSKRKLNTVMSQATSRRNGFNFDRYLEDTAKRLNFGRPIR